MKITSIRLHPVATRRRTRLLSQHVIVEMEGEGGVRGFGEMSDFGHLPLYVPNLPDLERVLSLLLADFDAEDLVGLGDLLLSAYPEGWHVYDMGAVIRCGVDIAAHDLVARSRGISLVDLLGGKKRDRFPVCYPIFRARGAKDVPARLRDVETALSLGFTNIRYYFGRDLDADDLLLSAIRDRWGSTITIKSLDASNLFDSSIAIDAVNRLSRHGAQMLESPTDRFDVDGCAEVRRNIDLPVSEHVYHLPHALRLIEKDAVDIFNICLTFAGGITPALKLLKLAELAKKRTLIGTTQELSIGTSAQAHLGASVANLDYPGDAAGAQLYIDDVVVNRVKYEAGYLVTPDGPGLGMELDEGKLTSLTDRKWGFMRE